jgi:hypothetical protein
MARKVKAAASFDAAAWISLSEAFARVKATLGSGDLAALDLCDHMRSRDGRLPSARRSLDRAGAVERLEPSFWDGRTLRETDSGIILVWSGEDPGFFLADVFAEPAPPLDGKIRQAAWFFVDRQRFDALCPIAASQLQPAPPRNKVRKAARTPRNKLKRTDVLDLMLAELCPKAHCGADIRDVFGKVIAVQGEVAAKWNARCAELGVSHPRAPQWDMVSDAIKRFKR